MKIRVAEDIRIYVGARQWISCTEALGSVCVNVLQDRRILKVFATMWWLNQRLHGTCNCPLLLGIGLEGLKEFPPFLLPMPLL